MTGTIVRGEHHEVVNPRSGCRRTSRVLVRHDPQVHTQLVVSPVDLWVVAALVSNGATSDRR